MSGENPEVWLSTEVSQIQLKTGQWVQVLMLSDYDNKKTIYKKYCTVEMKVSEKEEFEICVSDKDVKIRQFNSTECMDVQNEMDDYKERVKDTIETVIDKNTAEVLLQELGLGKCKK